LRLSKVLLQCTEKGGDDLWCHNYMVL
jgi:hypothetical protein